MTAFVPANSVMSAPAANALSPEPVSRITLTPTSAANAINTVSSSSNTFVFSACSTCGRFSVTRATAPLTYKSRDSLNLSLFSFNIPQLFGRPLLGLDSEMSGNVGDSNF